MKQALAAVLSALLLVGCQPRPKSVPDDAVYSGTWPSDGYWISCGEPAVTHCRIYGKSGAFLWDGEYLKIGREELRASDLSSLISVSIPMHEIYLLPFRVSRAHDRRATAHAMTRQCQSDLGGGELSAESEGEIEKWGLNEISRISGVSTGSLRSLFEGEADSTSRYLIEDCILKLEYREY